MMRLAILSLLLSTAANAYDVYLKDGRCLKNVSVSQSGIYSIIDNGSRTDTIESKLVDRIEISKYYAFPVEAKIPAPNGTNLRTSIASALGEYESQKKERSTALLATLIFPGGGLFYAEDPGNGFLFFFSHAAAVLWLTSANKDSRFLPWTALIGLRIWEGVTVRKDIEDYNAELRMRLFINKDAFGRVTPSVGLKINL